MKCDFVVGQRVVCINDDFGWFEIDGFSIPTRCPMINEVLTVSGLIVSDTGNVCCSFEEIERRQVDGPLSAEIYWEYVCFRPLIDRKTDISIFTDMLTNVGEPVDA